jgi:tetratricopeptide (TPR) repeat protein
VSLTLTPLNIEVSKEDLLVIKNYLDQQDYPTAGKSLSSYLLDNPDDTDAWFLMGRMLLEQDQYPLARMVYEWLVQQEGPASRWQTWVNLGHCYDHINLGDEAERAYKHGLTLSPDNETLLVALGTTYVTQYRSREAVEVLERAVKLHPNAQKGRSSLGFAYLQLREWGKGWDAYSAGYAKLRWRTERIYAEHEPRWDGKRDKGVRMIVHGEQGIGDQLAGLEPLNDVAKDCTVCAIEVSPKIANLVQRSFPDIEVHDTLHKTGIDWPQRLNATHHAGVFHLHQFYRRKEGDYHGAPYLKADPERRIQWRALLDSLGPQPKVGIAWSGGTAITQRQARKADLTQWIPILRQNCHFVSLEYRDRKADIEALQRRRKLVIHDWPWGTRTDDYEDTAALVAELDLVICVPTTVVHLAGGLGTPAWCMTHTRPNIHYSGHGDHLAYYGDRVRLYRRPGDEWVKTLNKVARDLEAWIGARAAA